MRAAERSRKGRRRDVGLASAAAHEELLATPGGQLIARIDRHRAPVARGHAQPAADAAAAVEPQAPTVGYRQRARQARRGERSPPRPGRPHRDRAAREHGTPRAAAPRRGDNGSSPADGTRHAETSGSCVAPRRREPEAVLDEREVRQHLRIEHAVEHAEVHERRGPQLAEPDAPLAAGIEPVERLPPRRLGRARGRSRA